MANLSRKVLTLRMPSPEKRKTFELIWAFEPFEQAPDFFSKGMFGCLAGYAHGQMVMVIAENHEDPDWSGILIPTSREHHAVLRDRFPSLTEHPVLGKWLYLPLTAADFEETARAIGEAIANRHPAIGILPGQKRSKPSNRPSPK